VEDVSVTALLMVSVRAPACGERGRERGREVRRQQRVRIKCHISKAS